MIPDRKTIGERLRLLRGDRTCAEIALAIGVTKQAISLYESGARVPTDSIKCKLADYYNKTVQDLFYT